MTLAATPGAAVASCAVLLGIAALMLMPPRRRVAVDRGPTPAPESDDGLLRRLRFVLAGLVALAGWALVGGVVGVVAGVVGGAVGLRVLARAETPAARRHREQLERELPVGIALFGVSLDAGADVVSALAAVAEAMPGAVCDTFGEVRHALLLGAAPEAAWAEVRTQPGLRRLAATVVRSQESGASVALAVRRLADDLAAERRAHTEALARRVGVQAALPLGVCFLPAFLLLGIVPMAVGLFRAMHLFG